MEFNKETFEKALKANKIVRYQQHFKAVVKSYLEIENQALHQPTVISAVCGKPCDELRTACDKCKADYYKWMESQPQTDL